MNIFTGLLFLQGHISNPDLASSLADTTPAEDYGQTYGQTYGNHGANKKALREPWDQGRRDPSLQPIEHPDACADCG